MRPYLLVLAVFVFTVTFLGALREPTGAGLLGPRPSRDTRPVVPVSIPSPLPVPAALRSVGLPALAKAAAATSTAARVETALHSLSMGVEEQSHPDALRLAVQAYYNYRGAHPERVRKPYLYFVDYGLDSRKPRGYVFDMDALRIVDGPFTVAHGRGSSVQRDGVPTRFSNSPGSATSSLGLFLAQETYEFSGHSSGRLYHSIGLRLQGLSGRFNSTARDRGVVVHGAPYVTPAEAGRSEGCPAMEQDRAHRLIPQIGNGSLVFLFSPNDAEWLRKEPWAHRPLERVASAD